MSIRKIVPAWKVVIEQRFYAPQVRDAEQAESEFASERDAKAFARRCFANGSVIRVERNDGADAIKPSQIAAWIIGTPRQHWPQ